MSNATYTRTVTVDTPDYGTTSLVFELVSSVASASTGEIFPANNTFYTLTLDNDGLGSISLPVPDNTGDAAWLWRVQLQDDKAPYFTLQYDAGSSVSLSVLLAAELSTTTPSDIIALLGAYVQRAGDTMTGLLILSGDPAVALGAATKQYVDTADALYLPLAGGTMTGGLVDLLDYATYLTATATATYELPRTARDLEIVITQDTLIDPPGGASQVGSQGESMLLTCHNSSGSSWDLTFTKFQISSSIAQPFTLATAQAAVFALKWLDIDSVWMITGGEIIAL